jgi:hypothetical protein
MGKNINNFLVIISIDQPSSTNNLWTEKCATVKDPLVLAVLIVMRESVGVA